MQNYKTDRQKDVIFLLKRNWLGTIYTWFLFLMGFLGFILLLKDSVLGVTIIGFTLNFLWLKICDFYFGKNELKHWEVKSWVFVGSDKKEEN